MKEYLGKLICKLFGHPMGGNIFVVGMDTYCPRCGRLNI